MTIVSIVTAVADNRVIGAAGHLPWRLPLDLARFRRLTMGKPVVMGRKTYESLPSPLLGRTCIVLSRERECVGAITVRSLPDAIAVASRLGPEVMVAGGAEVYAQALPLAHRLYLTQVVGAPEGDALFPEYDATAWRWMEYVRPPRDPDHTHAFAFASLERVTP